MTVPRDRPVLRLEPAGRIRVQVRSMGGAVYIWVSGAPRAVLNAVDQLVVAYPPVRIGPLRRHRWRRWLVHIRIDATDPTYVNPAKET